MDKKGPFRSPWPQIPPDSGHVEEPAELGQLRGPREVVGSLCLRLARYLAVESRQRLGCMFTEYFQQKVLVIVIIKNGSESLISARYQKHM